jgi:polyhydroxybutyrate depolymerase
MKHGQELRELSVAGTLLLVATVAACTSSGGSQPAGAGSSVTSRVSLTVDGTQRAYRLFQPSLPTGSRAPLLIVLHGYGDTAESMETTSQFDALATTDHFVVVYPEGLGGSWNAGSCCGSSQANGVDDVAFIKQVIDSLGSKGAIDVNRVFVTGFSNGAAMTHRLGCELADHIVAIASVAGALLTNSCNPGRPISVLEVHGTADTEAPYDGGTDLAGRQFPAITAVMSQWARLDGCTGDPTISQSGRMTKTTLWTQCNASTIVRLDTVVGGSHSWFTEPKDPANTVWAFFSGLKHQ